MENKDPNIDKTVIFESEEEKLLRGHEYDGIQELDNKPPPWLLWIFYISVVFSIVYAGYYHFLGGDTQEERYVKQMVKAQEQIDEYLAANPVQVVSLAELKLDEEKASDVYKKSCAACHGMELQGLVGPNLTDEYWVNGGSQEDIKRIIEDGRIEKAMTAWKGVIPESDINQLVLYIQSKKGSNPAGAKAAEGELYSE